jgi:hypothetical protein
MLFNLKYILLLMSILAPAKVAGQGSLSANQTIEQKLITALMATYINTVKPNVKLKET